MAIKLPWIVRVGPVAQATFAQVSDADAFALTVSRSEHTQPVRVYHINGDLHREYQKGRVIFNALCSK